MFTPEGAIRDWFWLYRPQVPSARAQSVQVVSTAHALAALGHRVEVCVEGDVAASDALGAYGLAPLPTLTLRVLPRGTVGSARYRLAFLRWLARTGGEGIAYARRKRHADEALRWAGGRFRLLLEVHEVDSVQDGEAGRSSAQTRALEARVLAGAWGVVANAPGTLSLLRRVHPRLPPATVIHNAARPGLPPRADAVGIGIVGSVRPYKDPSTVAAAAREVDGMVWVGADQDLDLLRARSHGRLRLEAPLPYRDVPERVARFQTLLLPLSPGRFGEALTSPLKLWDALASGLPLVAADTAAVRTAAEGAFVPYRPGDPSSLVAALRRVETDDALRRRVVAEARIRARTWADRARELEGFAARVLATG